MNRLSAVLKEHWQFLIIAIGILVVVGAICNWKWLTSPDEEPHGLGRFVYRAYGKNAYRALMGGAGVVIVVCGILLLVLEK